MAWIFRKSEKFHNRKIVIPSNVYFEFVDCIRKACQSFKDKTSEAWEVILYKHSRVHWVVGKYEFWEDMDEMGLKIIIKWNFKNDRTFNKSVEEGLAKPINTDDLPENSKEWLFLRRGIFLSRSQVDIIDCHLDSILQYSYYGNQDNKKIILKFIDFILTYPKMKDFVICKKVKVKVKARFQNICKQLLKTS